MNPVACFFNPAPNRKKIRYDEGYELQCEESTIDLVVSYVSLFSSECPWWLVAFINFEIFCVDNVYRVYYLFSTIFLFHNLFQ